MFPCTKCGKNSTSNAGRSAHERHCKAEAMTEGEVTQPIAVSPEPREEPKEVIQSTARVIVREAKGWKLVLDDKYHMIDNLGRTLGHFTEEKEAIRTFEGMMRHVR